MTCEDRSNLLLEYERWTKAYSQAIEHLAGRDGAEFDDALRKVDSIREECERVRHALTDHIGKHRCA